MNHALIEKLRLEIAQALARADEWLLVTLSYDKPGHVSYGSDTIFAGYAGHRELRGPRWRDFRNTREFAGIGYGFPVSGPLAMGVLAKHILEGGKPRGITMHRDAVSRWMPECAQPSPVLNSVHGMIGEKSPLYVSLGITKPRGNFRKRLTTKCYFCATTEDLTLHHLVYRAFGGATEKENLLCVCRPCHDKIHNGEIDAQELVWQVGVRRVVHALRSIRSERPSSAMCGSSTPDS